MRLLYEGWQFHQPTLGYLLEVRPPPARVLSIGCSLGILDALLTGYGYQVVSIDNDPLVLTLAEAFWKRLGRSLDLRQADAFDLTDHHGGYDVAYSAGLVEHWHGERAVELMREHARCAPLVQVEVPTRWTWTVSSPTEVGADMHPFKSSEFISRVRESGLQPISIYTLGGVPSRNRELIESLLPPVMFRKLSRIASYSMGIGVLAEAERRGAAPSV